MSAEFRFAPLGAEHLEALCRIDQASFSHPWTEAAYRQELEQNHLAHYLGCFHGEELVAFAGMWLVLYEGQVANVAVAPAWRQKGLGRQLMEQLILRCMALGGRSLSLEVRESNLPARNLYDSLGFRTVGLRKGYYTQPAEDAVLMQLDFPEESPE